jgi:hypothetical protein
MNSKRAKVIELIRNEFGSRFRVFDNTGDNKRVVAGQFPDVILFVMKIETGDNLVDSVAEWQALGSSPSVLYIVVPEGKVDEAKKLASATNVRARFASYQTSGQGVTGIRYE